jgi:hypothetical protein
MSVSKLQWETIQIVSGCEFQVLHSPGCMLPWHWHIICAKTHRFVLRNVCPCATKEECIEDMEYRWKTLQLKLEEERHLRNQKDSAHIQVIDEPSFCGERVYSEIILPLGLQNDDVTVLVTTPGLPYSAC